MQHTAVKPPRAADLVPVSMVSDDSCPGSRRCTCRSINPGATIIPLASKTCVLFDEENFPGAPTSLMTSPSSRTSSAASVLRAGSITRPFLISNILSYPFFAELGLERDRRRGGCAPPALVQRPDVSPDRLLPTNTESPFEPPHRWSPAPARRTAARRPPPA